MNATRATTVMTTDGAVFGTTTETPPEDPPPWVDPRRNDPDSRERAILHVVIVLLHLLAAIAHALNH